MSYISILDEIVYSKELSLTDKTVYITLKSFSNFESGACFPTIDTISKRCKLSKRTVLSSLTLLKKTGWIISNKRKDTSNNYVFLNNKKKGKKLVPLSIFTCLEKNEIGFFLILLSFRDSYSKQCKVTKEHICKRAGISKDNKLIVTLLDSLERKGVIVKWKSNREYEFAFNTLTYDTKIESKKVDMFNIKKAMKLETKNNQTIK